MAMSPAPNFDDKLFRFLRQLKKNNSRDWFQDHKEQYEDSVKHPSLQFISDFGPRLREISTEFVADPRPVGGSLFRIYRDVRFSKDKSPYKTSVGIQFRHKQAKDAHSPGFYLHLEPGDCFVGLGTWHPDGPTLNRIRAAIADDPKGWKRALGGKKFAETFRLEGDSLKRPPKGYDPDHPLIDDLKRKDFIAVMKLTNTAVTAPGFIDEYTRLCKTGVPLMRFLCDATDVPF
jgi:uncharacterized protein (TIGR02453 family)